jgi:signal transduction histidine kinase
MPLFDELRSFLGFSLSDSETLARFRPVVEPHYPALVEAFYGAIEAHPRAREVIRGGDVQAARLKRTMGEWLDSGLKGPHDDAFYERRCRIGRVHVRIGLPQHYMVTGTNLMRRGLHEIAAGSTIPSLHAAIDRWLDAELAIMLHTYREDSQEQLRRQTRLATMGQLTASMAHELRNPLSVVESSLFLLRRRVGNDPDVVRHLDKIAHQISASESIIDSLLAMTRDESPVRRLTRARQLVAEAVNSVVLPKGVEVRADADDSVEVQVEVQMMVRAVANVVHNAVLAVESVGGVVKVSVEPGAEAVLICVRDDGPGFAPDVLPRAFEPLVTTRAGGIGLGLALVRRVVERNGGTVVARNRPQGGAEVCLRLPVAARGAA